MKKRLEEKNQKQKQISLDDSTNNLLKSSTEDVNAYSRSMQMKI